MVFRYPAINKPAGIVHWLKHSKDAENVDWVVILDADMIIRGPIIPWELGAEKGRPVAAFYGYTFLFLFSVLVNSSHIDAIYGPMVNFLNICIGLTKLDHAGAF